MRRLRQRRRRRARQVIEMGCLAAATAEAPAAAAATAMVACGCDADRRNRLPTEPNKGNATRVFVESRSASFSLDAMMMPKCGTAEHLRIIRNRVYAA